MSEAVDHKKHNFITSAVSLLFRGSNRRDWIYNSSMLKDVENMLGEVYKRYGLVSDENELLNKRISRLSVELHKFKMLGGDDANRACRICKHSEDRDMCKLISAKAIELHENFYCAAFEKYD